MEMLQQNSFSEKNVTNIKGERCRQGEKKGMMMITNIMCEAKRHMMINKKKAMVNKRYTNIGGEKKEKITNSP
jgi:hypothetical protein